MENGDDLNLIHANFIKNCERKTTDDTASQASVNIRILVGISDDAGNRIIDTLHEFKI